MLFYEALKIPKGLTAIIGGGGKSTLLVTLGRELSQHARVLLCATARMYPPAGMSANMSAGMPAGPPMSTPMGTPIDASAGIPLCVNPDAAALEAAFATHSLVCAGDWADGGKLTLDKTPVSLLLDHADYVLAEADGSKGLPLKAHAPYEPVIPPSCCRAVLVLGADGFMRPIAEAAHRPALYASLIGRAQHNLVSPEDAARAVNAEGLGDCVFINKAEDDARREYARRFAQNVQLPVISGSLLEGNVCLLS